MTKLIEIFRNRCLKLLTLMRIGPLDRVEGESFTQKGDKIISYKNGYNLELHQLVDNIFDLKPDIEINYSHQYLEKKISDFLFDLKYEPNTDKSAKIDSFYKSFKNDLRQQHTFLIPQLIENLSVDSKIQIGSVALIPYSEEGYKNVFINAGYKADEKINLLDIGNDEESFRKVGSIAVIEVTAGETNKALEKSDTLIDEVLNIIRLFNIYHNFGIKGKYNQPRLYEIKMFDKDNRTLTSSSGWKDLTGNCFFTKERFENLKEKAGLNNMINILKKDENERTDMEKKLLVSIKWFAEIFKNRDKNENIIRLFTALETLLVINRNEEKKKNVAERLAFINYSDKNARIFVYELVEKLYIARSELIHEGKTNFKEIDFNTLLLQLHNGIINVAIRIDKYPNLNDWLRLIQNAKFSTKLEYQ